MLIINQAHVWVLSTNSYVMLIAKAVPWKQADMVNANRNGNVAVFVSTLQVRISLHAI